ncbi:MAG: 50S ribosomal protein L11 [Candidatus Micrarchaeaceae archaeon]
MSEVIINGLIEGGKATSGPPFGPALGPTGVNINDVISEINKKTSSFSGIKIPVKVVVDPSTKKYHVEVGTPPTSALILKELGIAKGGKTKDESPGDITISQAKKIAESKTMSMYGNTLTEKVTQVLGTCKSMNIKVEGLDAKEAIKKLKNGELKI